MEDRDGAASVATESAGPHADAPWVGVAPSGVDGLRDSTAGRAWLVSPAFDLACLANLWWLVAWAPDFLFGATATPRLEFWQVYFLTTPHRWLTLFLVATDPDRRAGRRDRAFVLVALALGLAVLAVRGATGAFTCLLLVDYVWNAWHFASQHGGVLRMYSRLAPPVAGDDRQRRVESFCLRGLVPYVFFRLAGWSTGWIESMPAADPWLAAADYAVLLLPLILVARAFLPSPLEGEGSGVRGKQRLGFPASKLPHNAGKKCYVASLCGLYASLLIALRADQRLLVASLATAVAAFHAVEYMAVVTHYARRRTTIGSEGLFRRIARHWTAALVLFVLACAAAATWAEPQYAQWWIGLNVWAALVHYSFDGMIWKLRRADTATALGLSAGGQTESTHRAGTPRGRRSARRAKAAIP